jgi:hypothetical protein
MAHRAGDLSRASLRFYLLWTKYEGFILACKFDERVGAQGKIFDKISNPPTILRKVQTSVRD